MALTEHARATAIPDVVATLREGFDSGITRPASWRRRQLEGLLRVLDEGEEQLLDALAADLGKPSLEGWATDLGTTANEVRHLAKHLDHWMKPSKRRLPLNTLPGKAQIVYEPLGVALVIAPWNYPVQLLIEPVAAAIAAGNAVVAKPSELAPATSHALNELLTRHLDPQGFAVVEGGPEVSTDLLGERFDHIFFTGSTRVGQIVMEAAAKHLTPVTLELGGKSPVIIDRSADLEVAARRVAWGKCLNAGQTCIAPDYVLVPEDLRHRFTDLVAAAITSFYGPDVAASADYGRIVSERHHDRLVGLIADQPVAWGGGYEKTTRFFEPTLVLDPDLDGPLMQEEIFGPILPIVGVDDTSAAIDFVRSRPKPLALYLFAEDDDAVDRVMRRTSSGGMLVNHCLLHVTPPDLPFGGVGPSGMGRYHGKAGFDTFSNPKAVLRKPSKPDPKLLYPPYSKLKERIVRRAL